MSIARFSLGVGLLALFLLVGGHSATALTIVPPSLEFLVRPGDTVETKVKLFNDEQKAITVFSSVARFGAKGEAGEPDFIFEDTPTGAAAWIDAPTGAITIQPNDRIELKVQISVPRAAEPGGHYAALFFGTDPSVKPQDGGQVTIRSLLGALVILRVEGTVSESATVAGFTVDGSKTHSRLPTSFTLRIRNGGNVHIRPQGTILIKNLFGGQTATLSLNEANGAVLPSSVRAFTVDWKKSATPVKAGNVFQEISRQWSNFALGPYTATASVTYGQSKQSLVATTTVTITPWYLMIAVALVILLVVVVLVFGLRGYNAAIIRRAQRMPPGGMK